MRVHALINTHHAGAALGLDLECLSRELQGQVDALGHSLALTLAEPKTIEAKLDAATASNPDILLVGGGDGTIRYAASCVIGTGTALSILPLGTVNRLAHDLNIASDPMKALRSFGRYACREIDVAEVNGRIFPCNSMLGLPPAISDGLQRLRGHAANIRVEGYLKLLRTALATHKRIGLVIDDEVTTRHVRVLSLAVSNNLYAREPALVLKREALDGGKLGIYIAKHRSGLGLLWVLARAGLGLWDGDSRLESMSATRETINSRLKALRLSNDGEAETLNTPLHYRIRPKALTVFAPFVAPP